jgi:rsbT antagonist protein RsbS
MSSNDTRLRDVPAIAIQLSRGVVVASIQVDLKDAVLLRFREDLLNSVHRSGTSGVILDVSGLETLDLHEFAALRQIISMVEIMGTCAVLVGLQPGVVSALVGGGADVDGLRSALDLDAAFVLLDALLSGQGIDIETEPGQELADATEPERQDGAEIPVPVTDGESGDSAS